ncbi:Coiled-coil and C2 domain-containing protein 1B [Cichlidogyrus casuarinus]|uniref:Coiled-coil and C2 domain-containing protein 1B n=1 Tax=Cichlidogyrus casuarinus TaxID=1844966 RepID=A0ABD2QG73_9PLAT
MAELEIISSNLAEDASNTTVQTGPAEIDHLFERKLQFDELLSEATKNSKPDLVAQYQKDIIKIENLIEKLVEGNEVNLSEVPQLPNTKKTTSPTKSISPTPHSSSGSDVVSVIVKRMEAYQRGIQILKNENNPSNNAKIRRYERSLDSLKTFKRRANTGAIVEESALPLMPDVGASESADVVPEAEKNENSASPNNTLSAPMQLLVQRQKEYKAETIKQRDAGNLKRASELMQILKILDAEVPKIISGEIPFDPENGMPPPPEDFQMPVDDEPAQPPSIPANEQTIEEDPSMTSKVSKENLEMRVIKQNASLLRILNFYIDFNENCSRRT